MNKLRKTSHFSEILEESEKNPVIIYKHSNSCGLSTQTEIEIRNALDNEIIKIPVYIVVVQEMPVLSKNIETFLNIKHESPQVIVLKKGKVTYNKSHHDIKPTDFIY
ncbi:MAG TPA: bacillithiol system redox-active protein YtxJ [Parcubacteria group bacterium]|jgi:bacillithiol system protein YtxJ|nr:bacillithiol system redox-active protein YtxJ [Parcubacteria group bacterium]